MENWNKIGDSQVLCVSVRAFQHLPHHITTQPQSVVPSLLRACARTMNLDGIRPVPAAQAAPPVLSWDYPSTERDEPAVVPAAPVAVAGPPPFVNLQLRPPAHQQQQQQHMAPPPYYQPPPMMGFGYPQPRMFPPAAGRQMVPGQYAPLPHGGNLFPSAMVAAPVTTYSAPPRQSAAYTNPDVVATVAPIAVAEEERKERIEEMFPAGKTAELELFLQRSKERFIVGLEFMIEIQHNTIKKMQSSYSCLLCDSHIKTKDDTMSTVELARGHLRSLAHKLKYLSKYFPIVKAKKVDIKKPVDLVDLNNLLDQITSVYGSMKVKIVVGQKLFKKKLPEIKAMVENSSHFKEDSSFLESVLGKEGAKAAMAPASRIDKYADAFEELERVEKQQASRTVRNRDKESSSSRQRDPDSIPLVSTNPGGSAAAGGSRRKEIQAPEDSSSRKARKRESPEKQRSRRSRSRSAERRSKRSRSRDRKRRSRSRSRDRKGRSRSRSRDRKSKRTRSRSRSRRSRSRSADRIVERFRREDERVIAFLEQEREVVKGLEESKKRLMDNSAEHPDYNSCWAKFYSQKCKEYGGVTVQPEYVNDEWGSHWKAYFFKQHEKNLREQCNKLMNKHKIFHKDLLAFEERHPGHMKDKYSRSPPQRRSTSPGGVENAKSKAEKRKTEEKRSIILTKDDVTVIATLRLLSALESVLDDLGPAINASMGKANSLEVNSGFGTSMQLVNEPEFFRLLDAARERLRLKMSMGTIVGRQQAVSEMCVDNIAILMQQSSCEKEEVVFISHEVAAPSTAQSSSERTVKAEIAKFVSGHYRDMGKPIGGDELARIVEAEYQRVKHRLSDGGEVQQPQRRQSAPTVIGTPLVATGLQVDWGALQSAVQIASSGNTIHQQASSYHHHPAASGGSYSDKKTAETDDSRNEEVSGGGLDDLTIEDLVALFKNFKELDRENQEHLIEYMKKLEKTNPTKVKELKQHIHKK